MNPFFIILLHKKKEKEEKEKEENGTDEYSSPDIMGNNMVGDE